jgi:hypothetical protein
VLNTHQVLLPLAGLGVMGVGASASVHLCGRTHAPDHWTGLLQQPMCHAFTKLVAAVSLLLAGLALRL